MGEIVKVPVSSYKRPNNSFSCETLPGWYSCRDSFQYYSNKKNVIFYHSASRLGNVARFLRRLEELMELRKAGKLNFIECDDPKVLCMKLSNFWKHKVRRSLLTILIRAGRNYVAKHDNWKECIESNVYCKSERTRESVLRFIKGHTKLPRIEHFNGWCNYFNYGTEPIKDILK